MRLVDLHSDLNLAFLDQLEYSRHNAVCIRNLQLTAPHAHLTASGHVRRAVVTVRQSDPCRTASGWSSAHDWALAFGLKWGYFSLTRGAIAFRADQQPASC